MPTNNPTKTHTFRLSAELADELDYLETAMGAGSQQEVVERLIRKEYDRQVVSPSDPSSPQSFPFAPLPDPLGVFGPPQVEVGADGDVDGFQDPNEEGDEEKPNPTAVRDRNRRERRE
jgi:hypothetical protein